ncbi:MAG TPA: HIT family protein [Ilumatobacteraceae bacterium]
MPTVFTRIIDGELPGVFLWRDERCAAFMSINPISHGHALVVPIEEVDHWIDGGPELAAHLFHVAYVIGQAQQTAFGCERIAVIVAGFEVPHAHVHVIPANDMGDLSFANAKASVSREELDSAASRIRAELTTMGRSEVAG